MVTKPFNRAEYVKKTTYTRKFKPNEKMSLMFLTDLPKRTLYPENTRINKLDTWRKWYYKNKVTATATKRKSGSSKKTKTKSKSKSK